MMQLSNINLETSNSNPSSSTTAHLTQDDNLNVEEIKSREELIWEKYKDELLFPKKDVLVALKELDREPKDVYELKCLVNSWRLGTFAAIAENPKTIDW